MTGQSQQRSIVQRSVKLLTMQYDIGCFPDPEGAEMMESQQDGIFADAAYKYGIAGSGANKLSLAYSAVWKVSGRDDWFHGSKSQPTGDCVGRGCSHSLTGSLACAVFNGVGSWPEIADEQYRSGMPISPVGTYWGCAPC